MESYRYDLIDVGRQAISAQFGTKLNEYKAAFEKGDADGAATLETACLAIIVSRQPLSKRLWVWTTACTVRVCIPRVNHR